MFGSGTELAMGFVLSGSEAGRWREHDADFEAREPGAGSDMALQGAPREDIHV